MHSSEELLESKELREKLINRLEVLDKIKQLVTIPNTELLTVEQVAEYYEVDVNTLNQVVTRHYDELTEDGFRIFKKNEILDLLHNERNVHDVFSVKSLKTHSLITINNLTISVNNRGIRLFTRRAVLRVGMLLRDSEVAKRIRTYLLDVENLATTEQKMQDITEEDKLLLSVIKAKTNEERLTAMNELYKYVDRYKTQVDNLMKENNLLAHGISCWQERQIINKLVRKLAYSKYNSNFWLAWDKLYDEMLYKHNINIKARLNNKQGKDNTFFDVLTDEEIVKAFQSIVALCKENNVDVSEILEKHNA